MISPELAKLLDNQFEIFRQMLLRQQTFMLRKDYIHREAFIVGSFRNLMIGYQQLHETVKANYEKATEK